MDWLRDFWLLVEDVWNHGFLGTTVGDILIAIGIVVVSVFIRRLFSRAVISNLKRATSRTRNLYDDAVLDALAPPLRLVPVILGLYLAFRYLDPAPKYLETLVTITRSMVAFTIFWAIYRAIAPVSHAASRLQDILGAATLDWVIKAVRLVIIFIGAAIILEMWGIQVGPLLAGLGLFGVAVALGAQDLFKNLIAGMAILTEKRFSKGEAISVDGIDGTVEAIGFRSTYVRRVDQVPVYLPNSKLADGAVANLSRLHQRRIAWTIGLEYNTTSSQLRRIRQEIEDYIMAEPMFAKPPEGDVRVRIQALSASSIDMIVQCFTATSSYDELLLAQEALALKIKEIVEDAGAAFAFPSQSVYVEEVPGKRERDDDERGAIPKPPEPPRSRAN